VRRNLGRGRQCAGRRSPGSTGSAEKPEKLRFTGSSEHRPGGAGWIGGKADAELDPEGRRDPSGTDVRRADTVHGMVQARWRTGNGVESGPVSVELRERLRHVDVARGIRGRSAGTWSEECGWRCGQETVPGGRGGRGKTWGGSRCTWERPGCVSERQEARASPEYGPEWLRRRRGDVGSPGASDRGPRSLSQAGL
jgi:hypothetical protein